MPSKSMQRNKKNTSGIEEAEGSNTHLRLPLIAQSKKFDPIMLPGNLRTIRRIVSDKSLCVSVPYVPPDIVTGAGANS